MALTLTLAHRRGLAPREARTLAGGTLSIGRAAGNDWVLDDPDRHLSKTHCVISIEAGRPVLTDLSTNGVFVNGAREPTQRDSRVALTDGDEFRLGDYVMSVTELDDAASAPDDPFSFGAPTQHPTPPGAAPAPASSCCAARPTRSAPTRWTTPFGERPAAPAAGFGHRPTPVAAPARAPDPFDLLDEQQRRPGALDDDLFHGATPSESWQGPTPADNVDAPAHAFSAPRPIAPMSLDDLDFDALLGDTPPGQAAAPPLAAPALVPVPTQPAPVSAPGAAATPADGARLLAAFLAGAGVPDLRLPSQDPEAAMQAAGALFRVMVEGLRDVLMSRTAIKNEFRMEQTMLRARDNNALKFSVTPEEAVAALLLPDRPGYKPPLEAAREAFDDVRGHEMAVMAGVQTALIGLLRRFDPAALEKRLQPGMLDAVLPGARRARTWELFCATYKDIAREAEDDFQSVFGREFARAYDAQTRKL